jgi:hypothetical protein
LSFLGVQEISDARITPSAKNGKLERYPLKNTVPDGVLKILSGTVFLDLEPSGKLESRRCFGITEYHEGPGTRLENLEAKRVQIEWWWFTVPGRLEQMHAGILRVPQGSSAHESRS